MKRRKRPEPGHIVGEVLVERPLDELVNEQHFEAPWDLISDKSNAIILRTLRKKLLKILDYEEYEILIKWYGEGLSPSQIAGEMKNSYRCRVRRKLASANRKIQKHFDIDLSSD